MWPTGVDLLDETTPICGIIESTNSAVCIRTEEPRIEGDETATI